MKRIVALLALMLAILPIHVTAENEIDPKDCIPFPADCKKADVAATALYAIDVPAPQNYDWSSNVEALHVTEDGVFSLFMGKGTLTGVPKDGKGETIKISLSAPDTYFSSKDIVIDSPDGEDLYMLVGVNSGPHSCIVSTQGDQCFTYDSIDERKYGICEAYHITPVREGKGYIMYTVDNSKQYKIKITVKKSAIE